MQLDVFDESPADERSVTVRPLTRSLKRRSVGTRGGNVSVELTAGALSLMLKQMRCKRDV